MIKRFKIIFHLFACISWITESAQDVTFSKNIAPIIYQQCSPCHQAKGTAPFALENYEQVKAKARQIKRVVEQKIMPPWKADPSYRHFMDERILTASEIKLIADWVDHGCAKGDSKITVAPAKPKTGLPNPDIVIKFKKPFKIEGDNYDWFVTYIQPIELDEDRWLRAIEIIPGNKKLVHHCRVDFHDDDAFYQLTDSNGFVSTDKLSAVAGRPALNFVGDYVPGISPYVYPDSVGLKISKKMYIMVNVHYAGTPVTSYDETEVHLFFYDKHDSVRPALHIGYKAPLDKFIKIPSDSVSTYFFSVAPLDKDYSLIAIQPHMHLIGKSMKIYAVTPGNDTIKLCKIDNWDFAWQENYYYRKAVKLPKGTVLTCVATYDNSAANPRNPFSPPRNIDVNGTMLTTNEMFEFYVQMIEYKPGDENLKLTRSR